MLHLDVVTLFPTMFNAMQEGIAGRASSKQLVELVCTNPRDFTTDKHRTVDDSCYGGGPGMLLKYQPLKDSLLYAKSRLKEKAVSSKKWDSRVIYLSPQGKRFCQKSAGNMAHADQLIFVCGRYEGVDERFVDRYVDEEWSVGDYVLSGGELAAMVMMDSVIRLLPGALGHHESAENDSYSHGLLDYPHYTKPASIDDMDVPPVLLSGNHKDIAYWREQQSLLRTWRRRPDLLDELQLTDQQLSILNKIKKQK